MGSGRTPASVAFVLTLLRVKNTIHGQKVEESRIQSHWSILKTNSISVRTDMMHMWQHVFRRYINMLLPWQLHNKWPSICHLIRYCLHSITAASVCNFNCFLCDQIGIWSSTTVQHSSRSQNLKKLNLFPRPFNYVDFLMSAKRWANKKTVG